MRKIISFSIAVLSFSFLGACSGGSETSQQTWDGRVFDISANQDNSLIATTRKVGYNYSLTISGQGEARSYSRKEEVPWNTVIKKIVEVNIEDGISNIGDYYFYSLPLEYFVLPYSVDAIDPHSFASSSIIYTFGGDLGSNENVYYYSSAKPVTYGQYFYMEDGIPHQWIMTTPSFLFIGNSFTFRQGTEDNPAVPKYFERIAENLGIDVDIDYVVRSSYTLTKYANKNDELGAIVEQKLTSNHYDYVILQEQSTTPINNYNNFLTAVQTLKTRIDQTQTKCKTILYETWGSPAGIEGTSYKSVGEMELALRNAYTNAGNTAECSVNYIGKAFTYAYETLNKPQIYADDNRHQSNLGAYFSAACHVRSVFNIKVSGCTDYCDLDMNECKALLSAADYVI